MTAYLNVTGNQLGVFSLSVVSGTCVIRATTAANAGRASATRDLTININN